MRRSFITLALFLAASSVSLAQDWAREMFDHTSHDFGVVARGQQVEHRFPFENPYLEDTCIGAVHSSCSCITPEVTQKRLKTHEKGEVVATVNTRKFLGRREATFRVVFAEPFPAEVQLHCYVYIRSDVVLEPGTVQFGSVPFGKAVPPKKVSISYAGRDDWKIVSVESDNPHLDLKLVETGRQMGQVSYDLLVGLAADAPVGYIRDHVRLITNDRNQNAAHLTVAVEGIVTAVVSVKPSFVMLGLVSPGQKVERTLVVRGEKPFRITDISGPNEQFQFEVADEAKTLHVIPVTFTAGSDPGMIAEKICIQTDVPGSEVLEVKFDGQVVMPSP